MPNGNLFVTQDVLLAEGSVTRAAQRLRLSFRRAEGRSER